MAMRVGVIGDGRLGGVLAERVGADGDGAEIVAWSPVKEGAPRAAWAVAAGVPAVESWQDLVARVDAVVVDLGAALHWHEREVLAEAVFEAGRSLFVDAPLADFPQVYDRIQAARRRTGARLWSARPLRRTLAVTGAVDELAAAGVGEILAVHASLHLPVGGGGGGSFEQATCDLLDAALALAGGGLARVFAEGERGPDGALEALQAVGRTAGGAVVSLEVAQVLPPSLGEGRDLTIEVTGRDGLLRVEPDRSAALVATAAVSRLAWREAVLAQACAAWLGGADEGPAEAAADQRVIGAMRMIKRSRARGQVETAEAAAGGA